MHDCVTEVLAYHNDKVTLPQAERTTMRDHRNANRGRLKSRLQATEKPTPDQFIKQGSYAMRTMVQDPDNDYDIDDGVYFTQQSLKDDKGYDMSPKNIREMVCLALQDDRFNKKPQVRESCVRVYYNEGYHVDLPLYRIRDSDSEYELATGDNWVVSRASDVEEWFDNENKRLSPDTDNGRQFRRIVRDLKKFARSRKTWKEEIASGFIITKLAAECFMKSKDRDDTALRDTMKSIYNRLCLSLEVLHPITPGTKLTKGPNDLGTSYFRNRLKEALEGLAVLDEAGCTRKKALAAWDRVFNTSFFSARLESESVKATSIPGSLKPAAAASGLTFPDRPVKPNKPAGFA